MDASKHPTNGLCTPKMEPIHKINYIKRRLAKACSVPEKKSLDNNILDWLKRRLLSLEDSFVYLPPKSRQNHVGSIKYISLRLSYQKHPPRPRDDPSPSLEITQETPKQLYANSQKALAK